MDDVQAPAPFHPGTPGNLHLYTGDGKGKTTAAVGLAVRAAGWGRSVLFAQFLKDPAEPSGEVRILGVLPGVTILRVPVPVPSFAAVTPAERASVSDSARALAALVREALAAPRDLVVLDELAVALSLGCLPEAEGRALLDLARAAAADVVVTGRGAPAWLIAAADLITEMRAARHPFDSGVPGREGMEW